VGSLETKSRPSGGTHTGAKGMELGRNQKSERRAPCSTSVAGEAAKENTVFTSITQQKETARLNKHIEHSAPEDKPSEAEIRDTRKVFALRQQKVHRA
jgi:hypothetical protein